jgi:nucleoside-diphosphate-sugar epimerase
MPQNRLAADLDHVLDYTRELWEELRGERIFITGGTGFFGCWLLESFAWANERLGLNASSLVLTRNLDLFRNKAPHLVANPAVLFHPGDVRSFDFPPGTFSHVIHAATDATHKVNPESSLILFDTMLSGTHHTLDFASRCGAHKYLLTSSGAVYGRQPPDMSHIPEEYLGAPDPTDPLSFKGEGKRASETLCALYAEQYGLETKIARGFSFVGPYLPLDYRFAIGNFIRDGLKGGPIIIEGDGTPLRSYLYASDLAIWLWTILFKGQSCRPYNVGSDESISIAELAQQVASQFPTHIDVKIHGKLSAHTPIEWYIPNVQRAKMELNLERILSLSNAIHSTIIFNNQKG